MAAAAACILLFHAGCRPAVEPGPEQQSNAGATAEAGPVTVRFEWPDDRPTTTEVVENVPAGTTLETVLRDLPQPEMQITGGGQTALVQSICGVEISGDRGWTFEINDNFATRGVGSTRLTPPTTITWRYTSFEEASQ